MPVQSRSRALVLGVAAWVALALVTAAAVAAYNHGRIADTFEAEARTLYRILSQGANQHEAHLTGLAAILATPEPSTATLRAVAEALLRFYPRIAAIDMRRCRLPHEACRRGGLLEAGVSCLDANCRERAEASEARALLDGLTTREREVLDMVARGWSTKEIARALDVSPRTIETHRANLGEKLGTTLVAEMVRIVLAGRFGTSSA